MNPLLKNEFIELRRLAIEREFSRMNPMQRRAVLTTEGPVLVLAGAGSGKTTVLISRIANLIRFGRGYSSDIVPPDLTEEDMALMRRVAREGPKDDEERRRMEALCRVFPVRPFNILAITFTNKAAGELKERLKAMLGDKAGEDVWAGTFHSACVRILRRDIGHLGRERSFTIYDSADSLRLIKDVMKAQNVDEQRFAPKGVASQIGRAKNMLLTPAQFLAKYSADDYRLKVIGEIYEQYQSALFRANALDFDDIIMQTVLLLKDNPDILSYYQDKFRYVMVDEYQDTNQAQYQLVSLLSSGWGNICVVGDDDQSIYAFRGATIENILSFEKQFENATVIRLEQNYRSTACILDAANRVIEKNTERKGKRLWTDNSSGSKITLYTAPGDRDEAQYIADTIFEGVRKGGRCFNDYAILYRMNAQSALLEREFSKMGLPHRIIGGVRFYDRKEIKDILSYLCVIANPDDNLRLKRIINEPKRGIGGATVEVCEAVATSLSKSMLETCSLSLEIEPLSRASSRLLPFYDMINGLIEKKDTMPLNRYIELVLSETGYIDALRRIDDHESRGRIENLMELVSNALSYEQSSDTPSLDGFLEEVSLLSDIDNHDPEAEAVSLMTVHSAKGLEFPAVFLYGMEESIFPSMMSSDTPEGIEEERRLCYVAITRARELLYITCADSRILYGRVVSNRPSRFLTDIPSSLIERRAPKIAPPPVKAAAPKVGRPASMFASSNTAPKAPAYRVGQQVSHSVFGRGMVVLSKAVGNDTLLEVAFDKAGTKKLMANFAKLKILDN